MNIRRYADQKISIKLSIMYVGFLSISIILSLIIYINISRHILIEKNNSMNTEYLYALENKTYNILDSVSNGSRMIIGNNDIQEVIRDEHRSQLATNQSKITKGLVYMMQAMPYIQSIYIFDNYGNRYGCDKDYIKTLNISNIKYAPWYEEVKEKDGYFVYKLNANHIFMGNKNENAVSLLRVINSTLDFRSMGILMINISENAFKSNSKKIESEYTPNILLLDEKGEVISKEGDISLELVKETFAEGLKENGDSKVVKIKEEKYLVSYIIFKRNQWKAVISMPLKEVEMEPYQSIGFVVIILCSIFVLVSIVITHSIITRPIEKLASSMKQMESGRFVKVEMETSNDEIGQLKKHYNDMVDEIEKLFNEIYEQERFKRKAELKILQEQIKPHFLYNTIDAMRYLAYSGNMDDLCLALESFGNYYRMSLSKGREIIRIQDEIQLTKDYVWLQQMRYGNILEVNFNINDDIYQYSIPKLILQPLIENAIYHGIKPKMAKGHILISAGVEANKIFFRVADDGVGMTPELLKTVREPYIEDNKQSFGLRSTWKRLCIYYDCKEILEVESKVNEGTTVTLWLPVERRKS